MAWTAPITATTNATFTSAQFNSSVRDNLLETAPAKATTAGSYFVTTGANAIAERISAYNEVITSETTTSTSYTALATAQAVTVTTGTQAIVIISAQMAHNTAAAIAFTTVVVSGATTIAATDDNSINFQQAVGLVNQDVVASRAKLYTLTPGSNTFTLQFKGNAGTSTFSRRSLLVLPL